MKFMIGVLVASMIGCASVDLYGEELGFDARIVYTDFSTVSSHGRTGYGVKTLLDSWHQENLINEQKTRLLLTALERSKIGKATYAEKKQMRGPIYLAIFRSDRRRRPVYVSNGCHVLNLETDELYRLEADTAISILGVPKVNYESRLCKEPGLGITLSPR